MAAIVDPFDKPVTGGGEGIVDPFDKKRPVSKAAPSEEEDPTSFKNLVGAAVEPAVAMGTGVLGAVAGGIGGIGAGINKMLGIGKDEPGDVSQRIQRKLTYEPRTTGGKNAMTVMEAPFRAYSEHIAEPASAAYAERAGPVMGSVGRAAMEFLPQLLFGKSAGELERVPQVVAKPKAAAEPKPIQQPTGRTLPGPSGEMAEETIPRPGTPTRTPPAAKMEDVARELRAKGFVLPPSEVNPTMMNRIVEGWAGKTQVSQLASLKNQPKAEPLIRRALGLKPDAPIEAATLNAVREEAGKAYKAVGEVPINLKVNKRYVDALDKLGGDYKEAAKRWPDRFKSDELANLRQDALNIQGASPSEALEFVKKLRFDGKSHLKDFANPDRRALGFAERATANAVERLLDTNLEKNGYGKVLVPDLKRARVRIAQSYDVETALNDLTGNVDARVLAGLAKKQHFSGELETIAKLGGAFKSVAKPPEAIGGVPGVNPLDVGLSLAEAAASGNPRWIATILGRPLLGKLATSDVYQNFFVNPPQVGVRPPYRGTPAAQTLPFGLGAAAQVGPRPDQQ